MTETYRITRFYFNDDYVTEIVDKGLSLEQAQAHCNDPQSDSSSATDAEGVARTEERGPWFDGYTREGETTEEERRRMVEDVLAAEQADEEGLVKLFRRLRQAGYVFEVRYGYTGEDYQLRVTLKGTTELDPSFEVTGRLREILQRAWVVLQSDPAVD